MKDKIFTKSFIGLPESFSFVVLLELEDPLASEPGEKDFVLETDDESLGEISMKRVYQGVPFLLESDVIQLNKSDQKRSFAFSVKQDIYVRVRVRRFGLSCDWGSQDRKNHIISLAAWEDLLEEERSAKNLEVSRLFALFQTFLILKKTDEADYLARLLESILEDYESEMWDLLKSYQREKHDKAELRAIESDVIKFHEMHERDSGQKKGKAYVTLIKDESFCRSDKKKLLPYNTSHVYLQVLMASSDFCSKEIFSKQKMDDFYFVSKPFFHGSDLQTIPIAKTLSLDFWLSVEALSEWEVEKISWDERHEDFYLTRLGEMLRLAFQCE